ncbi:MAG: acyl-CoA desaturase [Gammaproteobacteria bacterium]|nr:acyl-CoA desaturase [Gammaproteobacteria bacterium]NIN62342.1 acyl-CoA desaturase [Gammaproteobacteria bacterium]NIO62351.1 acyl-CoA desaturase [Gammaproteobacteria bacterium]NIQ20023.1 acyl-CoA desaturase [Gammaproteobacteria bacterium]NIT06171.1 acyl-CoA desaturase [Gammaproteobacteria bacterium]
MILKKVQSTGYLREFARWISNDESRLDGVPSEKRTRLDPPRVAVLALFHIACLLIFIVGWSAAALVLALGSYLLRMFFITAFYHRYFSHRSYRVSRSVQFLMACLGCTAGQRGPLWWASHHRVHHAKSDSDKDPHSPRQGFLNSHLLWFLRRNKFVIERKYVKDWLRYPELCWLEKFDWIPLVLYGLGCYLLGELLSLWFPYLGVNGAQVFVWAFIVSTVLLYHATYTINSLAHKFGKRRYHTRDDSRNNWLLALLTLGEGWHNNHHRYPAAARQGFFWWELDLTYIVLKTLNKLGLISEIREVPAVVLNEAGTGR